MDTSAWRREVAKRRRGGIWPFLTIFFLILVLHFVAILLFTRGFLLTRTELPNYSNCSDVSQSPCVQPPPSLPNQEDGYWRNATLNKQHCWTKPAIDRLVIIILDALRFDFVAPIRSLEDIKPWMGKLQVLHELASQEGSSARIFKAIADPPTTSLQRLKMKEKEDSLEDSLFLYHALLGLTTGGLPTFIDVGNSFGAPAILEDNLISQLVQNGKQVVMMGDDTWLQLFPHHFNVSFPFPSFNVKDLHTVDDGCTRNLFPSLYDEDWDVLIAHFLGVKVVEVLEGQSGPGGLHENTLLLVMGDHGQTINGDHGGGSAEEVETVIFAKGFKDPPSSLTLERDTSSCRLDARFQYSISPRGKWILRRHVSEKYLALIVTLYLLYFVEGWKDVLHKLNATVTVAALLGIPFPFGSIGSVNPELYALAAGTWNLKRSSNDIFQNHSSTEEWMQNYVNVLCMNSWQVKRYIDVYSASSVIGFSNEDLLHLSAMYAQAMDNWSKIVTNLVSEKSESCHVSLPDLKRQIDAYLSFLASVAELARSKWTQFNLEIMGIGFGVMLISLLVHVLCIRWLNKLCGVYVRSHVESGISYGLMLSCLIVAIRACSFLSNSYILEEGKVAGFLAATTAMLKLRYSITKTKMQLEALVFVLLISVLRFCIELGLSKQAVSSGLADVFPSWMLAVAESYPFWRHIAELLPVLALVILAYMLHESISRSSCRRFLKNVIRGTIFNYLLIAAYWTSESKLLNLPLMRTDIQRNYIPKVIYMIGFGQLSSLALLQFLSEEKTSSWKETVVVKIVAVLSAWSSTIIILSGRQGPMVALASMAGGWCIMRLECLEQDSENSHLQTLSLYSFPVTQWSLLAVCLFFCSGHWCAFDGLHYAAAFIGFEEFILVPQAILLSIDTFGFSHILPIFGLPFLAIQQVPSGTGEQRKGFFFMQLCQVYLMYGLITATTATFTMLCVAIQRRHLMVWGLFAPKFVFDVLGLMLTDFLIFVALLYYCVRVDDDGPRHQITEK
ncbi:hypothetical protein RHMOL_Rhmol03G0298800 [Rhododendron molle]|uniref:Uncharacterized protein n=1 Tax=Rhododendron molle TaxID=49168 RepID=A0ACC0PJL7_RHOML|nr:hypothetical protein RHMOL_Rhmol03G0298800 [Rhododendron molle]